MGTVDYDNAHRIATGTAGRDVLDPFAIKPWTLVGLDGDDIYSVRVADYVNSLPGGVTQTLRGVDRIVEQKGGGNDTAILVTGYNALTSIGAKDLVNVEIIKVLPANSTGWTIDANGLSNRIIGARGADTIDGGAGDDRIEGGSGNDTLKGGAGNDLLYGGAGDDRFDGGSGIDSYSGGAGLDTLVFSAEKRAVSVNLLRQVSTAGETFSSIEGVVGTKLADTVTGSNVANALDGGKGDDILSGLGGNDTLTGAQGNDRLSGGDGNDTLSAGAGNDSLDGGAGDDVLMAGADTDILTGGEGGDSFAFAFKAHFYKRDAIYIGYERDNTFQSVITDFQDGVDKIRMAQADEHSAGVSTQFNDYAPGFGDIYLEQTADGTVVHFGHPGNGDKGASLHALSFGSVLLAGIDRSVFSADDFTGVVRSYLSSTELGYL